MVNPSKDDRFGLNKGRNRPKYRPIDIHCPNCGAGLEIKNEASELVVCDYCSSHLELSKEQLKVLGKGPDRVWEFPLKLGDRFKYRGGEYEVIARQAFIEDNDPRYTTREYLLYNPRKGTLWLDEYEGRYSLSWAVHVKPKSHPFTSTRGDVLETHDNRKWVCEEAGAYQLAYVDGALPWLAKVGDEALYAEFVEKNGSGMLFDVQAQGGEIEYCFGQKLSVEMVRRATGKDDLIREVADTMDAAQTRSWFMKMIAFAVVALIINGIGALFCMGTGNKVLSESYSPVQISKEVITKPFNVASDGNIIKVTVAAQGLSNAWMAVNLAMIEGDDKVVHVYDQDMEYYSGVEGGESWSEGSKESTTYIKIPKAGEYRILITAISAHGESSSAASSLHGLSLKVEDDASMPHFFIFATVISIIISGILIYWFVSWKRADEED